MVPNQDGWTVVLAGAWNPRIFHPEWLAEHVFLQEDLEMEFPDRAGLPYRYIAKDVRITPGMAQVVLNPLLLGDAALLETEAQAIRILETLSHTPINGIGVNFSFVEEEPKTDLLNLFNFPDTADLAAAGFAVETPEIGRLLTFEDGRVLNHRISLREGQLYTGFNFHSNPANAIEAAEYLRNNVLHLRDLASEMLTTAYGMEVLLEVGE